MKFLPLSVALAGVAIAGAFPAPAASGASASSPAQGRLMRVAPAEPLDAHQIEAWRKRLSQSDLDLREQAFEAAVELALSDEGLRRALEGWAREDGAPELAWTARLVLRESRAARDPFANLRGRRGALHLDPFRHEFDFEELRRQLLEDLGRVVPPTPGVPQPAPPTTPGGGLAQSESLSLQVGPDGVKCKLSRTENGQTTTEEFEAPSMEELLEAHPELRGKVGGSTGALPLGGSRVPLRQLWDFGFPEPGAGAVPSAPGVRTDILGVAVVPLSSDDSAELSLEPGLGLRVERVEPGTIAQQLGLQRGHVLVELNGRALRTRDDISEMLRAREGSGSIEVILIDRWGQRRTRTWKPDEHRQS